MLSKFSTNVSLNYLKRIAKTITTLP